MNAENTIQWMMDFYPDLYPTRKHCLDQLFCAIGNGYEWVNGELIDTDPDEFIHRYSFKEDVVRAKGSNESNWIRLQQMHQMQAQLDPFHRIPDEYRFNWYPISKEFSYILNYPEDITDSWRAALEECKQLLGADGIKVGGETL